MDELGVGDGGEAGALFLEDDESLLGTKPELAERARPPPETILALGGDEDEATREIGDVARGPCPSELLVDNDGDAARLVGGEVVRAAEVA